jgi:hypothetical protein
MAESTADTRSTSRRRAEELFDKRQRLDSEVRLFQQNRSDVETAKMARLKSLRLARDAAIESGKPADKPKKVAKKAPDDKAGSSND